MEYSNVKAGRKIIVFWPGVSWLIISHLRKAWSRTQLPGMLIFSFFWGGRIFKAFLKIGNTVDLECCVGFRCTVK